MSYDEGSIWKDPEPDDQPQTFPLLCGCGFEGEAPIRQTRPGTRETLESPAEPPTFVITCPCGREFDPEDANVNVTFEPPETP